MSVQAANKNVDIGFVEIKSKFDAEFRRFSVDGTKFSTFELFRHLLGDVHLLKTSSNEKESKFHVFYIDPKDDDLVYIKKLYIFTFCTSVIYRYKYKKVLCTFIKI